MLQLVNEIKYTSVRVIGGKLIANGDPSEVHEIYEPQLGGTMAAKEIAKGDLDPSEYFREAKLVYAAKHENVVPINYACARPDRVCLVMPLYTRGSVEDLIKDGPITPCASVRIAIGVLAALGHVHSKVGAHLDVKPSNILISDIGEPMLADFGETRKLSPLGTVKGPRMYLGAYPPEMYQLGTVTIHADIYQAGLLLYRMLNGEPFWDAQWPKPHELDVMRTRTLKGKLPDRQAFFPHVPRYLRTIIRKALQVDPAKRFNTAAEFRKTLGRLPVDLDWSVEQEPDRTVRWRASREAQPDRLVEKRPLSGGAWDVDVLTSRGPDDPRPRGKAVDRYRRKRLDDDACDKHLNEVFRTLSARGSRSPGATPSDDPAS